MSFTPRPIPNPTYQRNRFGSNPPDSSRRRGQAAAYTNFSNNTSNSNYTYNLDNNNLGNNKVADFTARRQQQFPPARTPQVSNYPRPPLGFPLTPLKVTQTSPAPNFVPPTPWWLRSLIFLKYGSGLLTGGIILITLTAYGSNVSTQRQWSEEFNQLESLRRAERQLVTANEVIKNQAAQQSAKTKELVRVDPYRRVYLPTPSPLLEPNPKATTILKPEPSPNKISSDRPLGY